MTTPVFEPLDYTGERMVPEAAEAFVFWEHVYRYRFAVPFVRNKRVLDIACGEGYGTAALLKAGAANVIGVDISEEACRHVQLKYGIDARVGDAERIPLPDASVDLVVSFETIEHIPNPTAFIDECSRVLSPNGTLIISTPNKDVYMSGGEQHNPYHCSEMNEDEFVSTLAARFVNINLFAQRLQATAWWNIDSLAAEHTFWMRTRGIGRMMRCLQKTFCPCIQTDPDEALRLSTVEQILKPKESRSSSLLNSYIVRPKKNPSQGQPIYFIATAQKAA